jgi:hypothetical protein
MHARPKALVDFVMRQEDRGDQRDSTRFPAADEMQGRVDALLTVPGIDAGPSSGQEDDDCPDAWAHGCSISANVAPAPKSVKWKLTHRLDPAK